MTEKKTSGHIRWLLEELPGLREKNIIPEESARALESYYAALASGEKNRTLQLAPLIFCGLSALLAALGIALIIAHNWDQFSAPVRLLMGFSPLVPGAVFLYTALLRDRGLAWSESGLVFLIAGCGTALAVTSQIYNLGGSADDFLRVWLLELTALFFLRRESFILPVSSWVIFLFFAGSSSFGHTRPLSQFPFLLYGFLPLGMMLLTIRKNPAGLLAGWFRYLLPPFCFIFLMIQDSSNALLPHLCLFLFFGLLFAEGIRCRDEAPPLRNPLSVFGFAGFFVLLLAISVRGRIVPLSELIPDTFTAPHAVLTVWILLIGARLAFLAWNRKQWLFAMPFLFGLLPLLRIPCGYIATVLGLLCAAEGIRIACRVRSMAALNAGALLICGLILAWFFNSDCSILTRGVIFVILGTLAGTANALFIRRFRKKEVPAHE